MVGLRPLMTDFTAYTVSAGTSALWRSLTGHTDESPKVQNNTRTTQIHPRLASRGKKTRATNVFLFSGLLPRSEGDTG